MNQPITLDALKVLDAIDRKGSFAAAAAVLYRVPSALTYSVQKLEEELGVTLFRREGRRAVLTPTGRVLLEQGREIIGAVDRLAETVRQVDSGWESRLNIAVDSIFDFDLVYPLLEAFYQIKPDIEINLYEEVLGGTWESVLEGRADLVIGAPEVPANIRGIRRQKFSDVEWVFAVSQYHPLAACRGVVSREAIAEHRAVVVRDSSRNMAPLTVRVFSQQPVLSVPTLREKIRAQRLGLGAGFLPGARIQDLLAQGELVALEIEDPPPTAPLFLAWKAGNKGKALKWFIENAGKTPICV